MLADGLSTVSFTLDDSATFVSATARPRSPGFRSSVGAKGGVLSLDAGAAESTVTVSAWELSRAIEIVSPARGSRASLIGRLRSGSITSTLTAASGGYST